MANLPQQVAAEQQALQQLQSILGAQQASATQTERQRDRETERQRDRETERQRDRETERQRQRERERERERESRAVYTPWCSAEFHGLSQL